MLKNQCISVTELRTKTKKCVENSSKKPQYIFVNNKPVAVLVNIDEYEANFIKPELTELGVDEVDANLREKAEAARRKKESELINI